MEHPLISDANDLSLEDLQTRISDLYKKLSWAQRHNQHLAHQISMALETYRNNLQQRQREISEAESKSAPDFSDRIDIS
jgi:hypothetical protein